MAILHPHLEHKKHVIWDWNGTLLLDLEHAVRTTNRLLAEENLPAITVDQYKQIFRFPVIEYHRDLGFDTTPAKFLELCERFNKYFVEGLGSCALWPGASQTLAHVKRGGKIQSLLSASEQGLLNHQVKMFELEPYFDHVTGLADKTAGSKVDRGRQLLATVGIAPTSTIMIGDTDHDLEVSQALGIELILVDHGHQCPLRLRTVHHTVLKIF